MRWVAQTTLKTMRDMGPPPRGLSWVTQTDPKNKIIDNSQKRAKTLVECGPIGHHCNQLKDLDPTIYHLTMARPVGAGWPLVTYRRVEWGQVGYR
jgi:hypothetical protein